MKMCVKISARLSSISSSINNTVATSMSLQVTFIKLFYLKPLLGNHTLAAVRDYSLLASLADIIGEINSLTDEPFLDGKH